MAAISREQADRLIVQLENDERLAKLHGEAGDALMQFIASGGEGTAPYFTPNVFTTNVTIVSKWAIENLPFGLQSCTTIGAWQIAFRQTQQHLTRDNSYLGAKAIRSVYIKLYDSLPAAQVRALAEGRLKDLNQFSGVGVLSMEQERLLAQIGGASRFRELYEELAAK